MNANLSSILARKKPLAELLRQAANFAPENWCVEDREGNLLFGALPENRGIEHEIRLENEAIGRVKSETENGKFIATLLENWLQLEAEKRQIGAETLQLYREINLVFAFSEKLASTLGAAQSADLTLREAGQIIRFGGGAVFFLNEKTGKSSVLAQAGEGISEIEGSTDFFQKLVRGGKSEIVAAPGEGNGMLLFAALKIGQRVLGTIVLRGEDFMAADLKLLSTLAFQAAAALESSVQHELAAAAALKEQREKLLLELALKHPFFKKAMAVVEARFADAAFSVADLSAALNLSTSQLQRKIGAITELTPVQIIRDKRLARAKELLRGSDLNVSEVAFRAGFNDPSYFSRQFAREFGRTPSEWKDAQLRGGDQAV